MAGTRSRWENEGQLLFVDPCRLQEAPSSQVYVITYPRGFWHYSGQHTVTQTSPSPIWSASRTGPSAFVSVFYWPTRFMFVCVLVCAEAQTQYKPREPADYLVPSASAQWAQVHQAGWWSAFLWQLCWRVIPKQLCSLATDIQTPWWNESMPFMNLLLNVSI